MLLLDVITLREFLESQFVWYTFGLFTPLRNPAPMSFTIGLIIGFKLVWPIFVEELKDRDVDIRKTVSSLAHMTVCFGVNVVLSLFFILPIWVVLAFENIWVHKG